MLWHDHRPPQNSPRSDRKTNKPSSVLGPIPVPSLMPWLPGPDSYFHKSRVRRASGLLLTAFSNATPHTFS